MTELRLIGSFEEAPGMSGSHDYPLVLGIVKRHLVSLTDVLERESRFSLPGFNSQTLVPQSVFFGGHLRNSQPLAARAFATRLRGLPEQPVDYCQASRRWCSAFAYWQRPSEAHFYPARQRGDG